jgi:hypothetical protein
MYRKGLLWRLLALSVALVIGCGAEPLSRRTEKRKPPTPWGFLEADVMADTKTNWQAVDENFASANNWDNGIPGTAANMVGIFSDKSQIAPQTNLDQSGATNGFRLLSTPAYRADLGSPGNPIIIKPRSGKLAATIRGTGKSYISIDGVTVSCHAVIDCGSGYVQLDRGLTNSPGWSFVMVKSGNLDALPTCSISHTLFIWGQSSRVTLLASGGSGELPQRCQQYGGYVTSQRPLTAGGPPESFINVNAGEWYQTGLLPTEVNLNVGGYFNYAPDSDPSAELPNLYVAPMGHFDAGDYDGAIPMGVVIKAPSGMITGSLVDQTAGTPDYDLDHDYPGG